MSTVDERAGYWDDFAARVVERRGEESDEEALRTAFGWSQYPGHGPGAELLGEPSNALELGFGRGAAVAALALNGVRATGIDLSPVHCEQARSRWGHLPGVRFEEAEAVAFLTDQDTEWDAVYGSWGAIWFTDPEVLLPAVRRRLAPGGRLVFSHAPPVPGCYGMQGMYAGGFKGDRTPIRSWAYEPDQWEAILAGHGFVGAHAYVVPAPHPDHVGTLIVQARQPG
ncbi:class I SAM-dependent methyltransferase [Streptomyces sp. AJS327]|uniref:class I SAM-dependent methyltransferase n=1 Tax=Streptomyces sp. AJS327 TaxID=2545265 RepID=UPI0015DF9CF3|nr:class I SAM-dependent methyltransferase [Streptomyces sp. AJS327]MBA0052750.1 class I SAM-dependent methyltransferase [Streptomyces sp. AJS327]